MKNRKSIIALFIAIVLLALALVGCSSESPTIITPPIDTTSLIGLWELVYAHNPSDSHQEILENQNYGYSLTYRFYPENRGVYISTSSSTELEAGFNWIVEGNKLTITIRFTEETIVYELYTDESILGSTLSLRDLGGNGRSILTFERVE